MSNVVKKMSEIGIEVTLIENNGNLIISHDEIKKIIMQRKFEVKTHLESALDSFTYVYRCAVYDSETDRYAEGFGESNERNLEGDIARMYPAEMASNRAIDRAVIQILGLSKVYSNNEIVGNYNFEKNNTQEPADSHSGNAYADEVSPFGEKNIQSEPKTQPKKTKTDFRILIPPCKGKMWSEIVKTNDLYRLIKFAIGCGENPFPDKERNEQVRKFASFYPKCKDTVDAIAW